jgi:hypothetical protein
MLVPVSKIGSMDSLLFVQYVYIRQRGLKAVVNEMAIQGDDCVFLCISYCDLTII